MVTYLVKNIYMDNTYRLASFPNLFGDEIIDKYQNESEQNNFIHFAMKHMAKNKELNHYLLSCIGLGLKPKIDNQLFNYLYTEFLDMIHMEGIISKKINNLLTIYSGYAKFNHAGFIVETIPNFLGTDLIINISVDFE